MIACLVLPCVFFVSCFLDQGKDELAREIICSQQVRRLGPLFPQKWLLGTTRANLQQDLLKVRNSTHF